MPDPSRLHSAYVVARDVLLAERVPAGHWVGELSTSALSTATAVMALHLIDTVKYRDLIAGGVRWLADHQNADGGWGDTVKSFSNISTTMLCRAALALTGVEKEYPAAVERVELYITKAAGSSQTERAEAIRRRYGKDRTFSVPILMASALAGLVPWREVPRLPFELACLPQSWYRFARLPVVSYALPALIAIGHCVHAHRRSWNPLRNVVRRLARRRSLSVLRRIQPTTGGYLEATPLTSFVVMALASANPDPSPRPPPPRGEGEQNQAPGSNSPSPPGGGGRGEGSAAVISEGVRFLVNSVRPDGSWPIDTNLATWVTTLSVNALAAADDLGSLDSKDAVLAWLLGQQYRERHPYTGADPGGWAWTDLAGGVPDCDDTPGALLAVIGDGEDTGMWFGGSASRAVPLALGWVFGLQNRDGGWPTFCRGWGTLPFDRSGADLTAHALRALARWRRALTYTEDFVRAWRTGSYADSTHWVRAGLRLAPAWQPVIDRGLAYLARQQRPDGSWLPLWFGNQHATDDINPVYGTARVLAAYRDLGLSESPECQRGVAFLLGVQNADGGWGGAAGCPSSVEETALAVEVLQDLAGGGANVLTSPARGEANTRGGRQSAAGWPGWSKRSSPGGSGSRRRSASTSPSSGTSKSSTRSSSPSRRWGGPPGRRHPAVTVELARG